MQEILKRCKSMKYTSFTYLDIEDIKDCERLIQNENTVILLLNEGGKVTLHWAGEDIHEIIEALVEAVDKLSRIYKSAREVFIEFIPEEMVEELNTIGFNIYVQYAGFWASNIDFNQMNDEVHIRAIKGCEYDKCAEITKACVGMSRGFFGENCEGIRTWNEKEDNTVLAAYYEDIMVGMIMLQIYAKDSQKGPCLFLREIAVDPRYNSKGIGRSLISKGFQWGREKGAVRSFLHCDVDNNRAIKIYNDFGYKREDGPCEIRMIKVVE